MSINYCNKIMKFALDIVQKTISEGKKDIIIIGDNSTGKSDLLRLYAKNILDDCYYIDIMNRSFVQEGIPIEEVIQTTPNITSKMMEQRLDDERFNKKDWFGNNDNILRWVPDYKEKLEVMCKDFFSDKIRFEAENGFYKFYWDNDEIRLSNGFQAVFRIFSELILCQKYYKKDECVVIIDELDEFLSAHNSAKIFNYIRLKFPKYKFVITTHSADMLFKSNKYILIALQGDEVMTYDGDDFDTLTTVNALFNRMFFVDNNQDDSKDKSVDVDDLLARLLNHHVADIWTNDDDKQLKKIREENLTGSQKLIYAKLKGWKV